MESQEEFTPPPVDAFAIGSAPEAAPETKAQARRVRRTPAYTLDLLVVRHGPAGDREEFARTGRDDDERPLTAKGIRQMRRAAGGLVELIESVDTLGTSPLVRARETAAIVAEAWDVAPDEVGALGEGDRRGMLRWVRNTAAVVARKRRKSHPADAAHVTVAIVGHEPDLGAFIAWLLSGRPAEAVGDPWIELKKGGACLLSFASRPTPRHGRLEWCLTRSQLERLRR